MKEGSELVDSVKRFMATGEYQLLENFCRQKMSAYDEKLANVNPLDGAAVAQLQKERHAYASVRRITLELAEALSAAEKDRQKEAEGKESPRKSTFVS